MLDKKLNVSEQIDAYTKQEDDILPLLKADKSEHIYAFSKQEDDTLLLLKADKSKLIDAYSKTKDDELLAIKLSISEQIDAYSKYEDDALLLMKADKTELDNYVDLTLTQTIIYQNQFGIINVSSISKQNKNNASILHAGDGDMLVSSLVSQPQLQEVRDIASGKSKGYVLATTDEMNTSMEDQENVAKLAIGDNLYIVNKVVINYWRNGSDFRALETELPDMSNIMTILGTATGGGNAIIDLSFSVNTLIPPKKSSFITNNFNETIAGQITFYTTIHSVGIIVQNYDNNSVVCAGGDKAIQDINASVDLSNYYNKSQTYSQTEINNQQNNKLNIYDQFNEYTKNFDDALLLLKANKTQLIDSCTKGEADKPLNNKAESGVSQNKEKDDAFLLLKADKTQLIDVYAKGVADNLLNNKANSGVSYTKGEDDALILLKADKTQLIDSYTKGETNALLNNKADAGVSYTKGEDDALQLLKADKSTTYSKTQDDALLLLKIDKTQLIDSYTIGETNNLLNNKANTGVSYTKGEDDALLLLKADKSTTCTKTETDQLISEIDVGDEQISNESHTFATSWNH
ncbi:MAG: hypothetical protein EZS28_013312 [Streblomastix strix]|uniref:Uncharacterized protein n=1 Tax=Streblomastix strix TaxID=222440 RepID=A0A5J4W8B2_9EUKA|nr:MAG: hypothetical protein EZS28_013312 [Streblomastix strix]